MTDALGPATAGRLDVQGLRVTFVVPEGPLLVLDRLDLQVAAGEFVAVVGPSGCGKSTFVHVTAGFLRPSDGSVCVDGEPVEGPSPSRGVVFQGLGLFPWRTVRENVEFGLDVNGTPSPVREERVDQLLRDVKLEAFAALYPAQLSGGMAQRVALARTLAPRPKVLLLDEPFGALDAQTRLEMQTLLLDLHWRHRMTVLLVTHDVEEALLLADRVLVMSARPGRILREFAPGLPRPRSHTTLTDSVLITAKRDVLECFREEALNAEVQNRTALLQRFGHRPLRIGYVGSADALPLHLLARQMQPGPGRLALTMVEHESGPVVLRVLERGGLDLALVGACPVLAFLHQGGQLALLRDGGHVVDRGQTFGLVVASRLRNEQIAAIGGLPIGINGLGTNADFFTRAVLVEPHFAVMPADQIVGELRAGRLEVAALFSPYIEEVLTLPGFSLKVDFLDLVHPLQTSVLVCYQRHESGAESKEFLRLWDGIIERLRGVIESGSDWDLLAQVLVESPKTERSTAHLPRWDIRPSVDRLARLDAFISRGRPGWEPLGLDTLGRHLGSL